MKNLDSQIHGEERLFAARPGDVRGAVKISQLLLARADVLGRIADVERVTELADDAVAEHPDDPAAHLLASTAASRFHLFDRAAASLDEAARHGADPGKVAQARAGLDAATGDLAKALPVFERAERAHPKLEATGMLAATVAEAGDLPRARRLFAKARAAYRDVSPLAIGWLEFQEGLSCERGGDSSEAARLYRLALEHLPMHVQAASHLAAIEAHEGRREAAIRLLEPVVQSSDDPEFQGQLSVLYRALGRTAEADRLRDAAATRYATLLARHPEAFADHAARFRLDAQGDAAGALVLAEQNLRLRHTTAAIELALTAALAANRQDRACEIGRQHSVPESLRAMATQACSPPQR